MKLQIVETKDGSGNWIYVRREKRVLQEIDIDHK